MARRPARIVRPPRVRQDLVEIASYIGEDSPRSAERFLAAAERTIERLARQPLSGSPYALEHPALADVRMTPIQRFTRYLIFYRVEGDAVQLLRIVHGARDLPTLLDELVGEQAEEE
jgi:toxin ParE1/3/4